MTLSASRRVVCMHLELSRSEPPPRLSHLTISCDADNGNQLIPDLSHYTADVRTLRAAEQPTASSRVYANHHIYALFQFSA